MAHSAAQDFTPLSLVSPPPAHHAPSDNVGGKTTHTHTQRERESYDPQIVGNTEFVFYVN